VAPCSSRWVQRAEAGAHCIGEASGIALRHVGASLRRGTRGPARRNGGDTLAHTELCAACCAHATNAGAPCSMDIIGHKYERFVQEQLRRRAVSAGKEVRGWSSCSWPQLEGGGGERSLMGMAAGHCCTHVAAAAGARDARGDLVGRGLQASTSKARQSSQSAGIASAAQLSIAWSVPDTSPTG
jgi:hypothetical protein